MTYTTMPDHRTEFEPSSRRVRVYFNRQLTADSKEMMVLRESNRLPLYYFPKKDVRIEECLQPSDHTTHSDLKGEGIFWHVQVGDKIANNAAFTLWRLKSEGTGSWGARFWFTEHPLTGP